ncbi:MAG: FAD-dependent oxidoreductase [Hyphomonadaceae bacterium]|nr:FAD-dependent oxidoreductase [Hyphomonadaceae bacterium]
MPDTVRPKSIAIIGAGIIGLSCALELANRGTDVTLYETAWPPRGASWAAAGMLAPAFEAVGVEGGHPNLFELCECAVRLWPAWADALERESEQTAGYYPGPSLALALDATEAERLTALQLALKDHAFAPEPCTDRLNDIEPSLTSMAVTGLLLPSDGQVDNRLTLAALVTCAERHPRIEIRVEAASLHFQNGGLDHAGHDATLLTAGWETGSVMVATDRGNIEIGKLDPALQAIEPIGGQMLSVAPISDGPNRTIRAGHLYIVPKTDRIIIGATSEPGQVLRQPVPEQIARLRAKAIEICPSLANAAVLDSWAGVRPGLKSFAPLLGETRVPGLFVAAGHYRNGILLAPITAQIMADLILDQNPSELSQAFSPRHQIAARV